MLTPSEVAAIRVRITKLETQYDLIVSGQQPRVYVDQNGERVEYSVANIAKLTELINELKAMIDPTFNRRYRPRPVSFIFPR
jgi:hypothetical protein